MSDKTNLMRLTMQVVTAYGSRNQIPPAEIGALMTTVRFSLESVGRPPAAPNASTATLTRTQIRRSITSDGLISFEDGKCYKRLKRHLAARGMTPDAYRAKWGLPADYPMMAANHSAARSTVATSSGLARKPTPSPRVSAAPELAPAARPILQAQEPEPAAVMQAPETEQPVPFVESSAEPKAAKARILGRLSLFGRRSATI